MYTEDDLLPLSALQHLSFCERQWGLIHLEGIWDENHLTVEGNILHQRSDVYGTETRMDVRIVRGLRLRSLRLGLSGIADVVEFHRMEAGDRTCRDTCAESTGICLPGSNGHWIPFPVEYKRGRPKKASCDEIQLCAQALCLEEMLAVPVSAGALFYGKTRRRVDVPFVQTLRDETESLAERLHRLYERRVTPPPIYTKRCENCSLKAYCLPKSIGKKGNVRWYLDTLFTMTQEGDEV